jgi:predicted PurR-regulated permease PerM
MSKEILSAEIANAIVFMVIVLAGTVVALARIFAPLIKSVAEALNALKDVNNAQTDEIAALRADFNNHLVQINLRFDEIPKEFQAAIGAEFARQFGNRRSNRESGILSRFLGLN